jgi:hypothetical protein
MAMLGQFLAYVQQQPAGAGAGWYGGAAAQKQDAHDFLLVVGVDCVIFFQTTAVPLEAERIVSCIDM